MGTPADTATTANRPAVLAISAQLWLILGTLGALWTLSRLLLMMVMGGLLAPEAYLPTLLLYLANGAVFVACIVFAQLLGQGRRLARLVLSAYVVILPALLYIPDLAAGPPAAGMPERDVLLSPASAAVVLAVAATVLMWLPPANAYVARGGARTLETPDGAQAASVSVPPAVRAAVVILMVSGVIAALEAVAGLLLLTESIGTDAKTTPALVLFLTLAAVAVGNLACAWAVRRGKPSVRPVLTVISVAGLVLVVLATVGAFSNVRAGDPWAEAGLPALILMTVFSQGLPVVGCLAAAVLIWLPSARRHFRRGAVVHPAGTIAS